MISQKKIALQNPILPLKFFGAIILSCDKQPTLLALGCPNTHWLSLENYIINVPEENKLLD